MRVLRHLPLLAIPFVLTACNASEEHAEPTSPANKAAPTQTTDTVALTQRFEKIGVEVLSVRPSDIAGLIEVQTNNGTLFSSPTGAYFLAGTLYSLDDEGQYSDVLAKRQAPINAEKITAMADSAIEYKADNEKYVVTVFTDITCPYCGRLHSQVKDYNELGITVRYLAFPRQGATGPVADQLATIWAAADPKSMMDKGKESRRITVSNNDIAKEREIIAQHHQLGRELGINGTPAIFLPGGELVSGYVPPTELIKQLEQSTL
ncbi:thioredoxin fold domain-containing protein [Vibrio sp. 10N.247.311.51]|uniref:thioredoxin fold domain-containing protein n=1 Tax=Vibrio sp. 10N.247.311.51 TaxID=3229996 RepID=UPI003551E00A